MLRNFLKVAWRNMSRQKMYSSIKIGGFALGLATCIVIGLLIRHELSYDKHYSRGEDVYRVLNEFNGPQRERWTAFPAPFYYLLKTEFAEVEKAARLIPYNWYNAGNNLMRRSDQLENTYEERFAYADADLLDILEVPMVFGNRAHALAQPQSIVLSRTKAEKYFGHEDPVGKEIVLNDDKNQIFTIGGVMEDFPTTSHIQYDFLITLSGKEFWPGEQSSWCCWNYNPYVRLRPGADPKALEEKMLSIKDVYLGYLIQQGNQSAGEVRKNHFFRLQPVGDVHLYSEGIDDIIPHGDIRYMWLFGGIAVFILSLACINFINLSTARSANRAREVGLRKVVGSVRGLLVRQFLTESIIFSVISFVLALVIVSAGLPFFNDLAGRTLHIPWSAWWFFPLIGGSALLIGTVAGAYPSFYLSAFRPIDVLKGSVARGARHSGMRSAMVVFQFATSIILIVGTLIIYRQMEFILNTRIGYDKDQVIMLQGANTLGDQQQSFKEELLRLAGVANVTISQYFPVEGTKRDMNQFWRDGKSKEEKSIGAQRWYVDEDYLATLGMTLLQGRNFNRELASDSQAVIINQAMAKALGLKDPVGEKIMNWETYTVIGVVEDFHFENMKSEIQPLCLVRGNWGNIASVKIRAADMNETIRSVTALWDRFLPHQPVRYTFLDESYARMHEDVRRMGKVIASFAVLAVVVACLGLFALSAFMVEQRNKEISVRLVLGASFNSIFALLTQNFVKLVLVSFVLAVPVSWYLMQTWLQDFKYRIEVGWDIFVLSGLIAVAIAIVTVSYQSVRAALTNPATNLRSE